MSSHIPPFEVLLTPQFQKDLKQLAKRYRSIRKDLEPLLEQLKAGELIGDPLVGLNREVFKLRLKNSDISKGKSTGYRIESSTTSKPKQTLFWSLFTPNLTYPISLINLSKRSSKLLKTKTKR